MSYDHRPAQRPPKPLKRTSRPPPITEPEHDIRHPQSSKNGIVLFIGEAGSGISTTLNLLFGSKYKEISRVNQYENEAGTGEILEFRTVSPVDNLRVIDVPGLGRNMRSDAQILASLKLFMDTDPDLSVCIPHAVVLVSRFDQSRSLHQPYSQFIRTLRAVNLLRARLVDDLSSNLVLVLTHYMKGKRRHRVYPQPHLDKFKQIVQEELGTEPYVVPAENAPEQYQLLPVRESHRLTSGLLYPENLVNSLLSVAKTSKSSLGYHYFHHILQNRSSLVFEPAPPIKFVHPERTRYRKFLQALVHVSNGTKV